jgi:hypothetical protein
VALKFEKPGTMSLKRHKHEVASDFDKPMINNKMRESSPMKDNAILIRF